jgi:phenylacetate-CoA ligase
MNRPQILSFLRALDETQYLPPGRMIVYQRRLLGVLLRHASRETAFYPDRLARMFQADGAIDWDRWQDIPVLTRQDAQENFEVLSARSMPPSSGKPFEDTSSGSTGRPLRHLSTDLQNLGAACCSERFFCWHGLKPDALTARIRATANPQAAWPDGRPHKWWRVGHEESPVVDLTVATTPARQIEWLKRIKPAYLVSYPSNLRELADVAAEMGETLRFDRVLTFAEMVTEDRRAAIRDYFGMEPLDRYGASEIGHISGTCPVSLKHHVSAEVVLLEILDDDDNPVPPGAEGRIIVTPFYNLAMPLIRYDIGDRGVLSGEPCPCGRTLLVIERLLGRTRNIFRFADGTSCWPILLASEMKHLVPARQFQVVQRTRAEIEFRYVPVHADQVNDLTAFTAYVRRRLHPSVNVTVTAMDRIERSAGGKYEDYLSMVQ